MPRLLDVSDEVRAEIGDEEADRLLAGDNAPGSYDCTSCRTPGDSEAERTSTVLFIGDETAVLAFAHATCLPSQVVQVTEEQLQGAVRSITGDTVDLEPDRVVPEQAVLGVTSGLVLIAGELHPALVVEPTGPIVRPGATGAGDDFLPLLIEQGFMPVTELTEVPPVLHGWSVLLAMGQLHAVLQPSANGGQPVAWWQAHQPLQVTEGWRAAANKHQQVLMFAAPVGSIGRQPREDLLRGAIDKAAANGKLVASALPLAGPEPGASVRLNATASPEHRGRLDIRARIRGSPPPVPPVDPVVAVGPGPAGRPIGHADLRRALRRVRQVLPDTAGRPQRRGRDGLHGLREPPAGLGVLRRVPAGVVQQLVQRLQRGGAHARVGQQSQWQRVGQVGQHGTMVQHVPALPPGQRRGF